MTFAGNFVRLDGTENEKRVTLATRAKPSGTNTAPCISIRDRALEANKNVELTVYRTLYSSILGVV